MSRCLSDRRLWRLSEGDASCAARVHVAACDICTARLHALTQDLSDLRSVLSGVPPSPVAPARRLRVRRRWAASVATLAAMVMVTWFAGWWWQPSSPLPIEGRQPFIWPFIEGVSAVFFPRLEVGFSTPPDRLLDLDDLQAALAWEWFCEGPEALASVACDDDTLALLGGER
jgi:hypothetical protein